MDDKSFDYNSDDNGEEGRDFVWDLYYCCGSEQDTDPNAERLTYRSEGEESEDPNEKEHDYSDEEDEGDSSSQGEESEDSDCVLNKRVARTEREEDEDEEDEDE